MRLKLGKITASYRLIKLVRFEVLTAVTMEITAFWDVTPCSQVDVY
jgi:hypothetical protein